MEQENARFEVTAEQRAKYRQTIGRFCIGILGSVLLFLYSSYGALLKQDPSWLLTGQIICLAVAIPTLSVAIFHANDPVETDAGIFIFAIGAAIGFMSFAMALALVIFSIDVAAGVVYLVITLFSFSASVKVVNKWSVNEGYRRHTNANR